MYIQNLTTKDLLFQKNTSSIILTANATTLIPDGLTTLAELQGMFGQQAVAQVASGPSTSILTNQQAVSVGKLYMTEPITNDFTHVRLYVNEGATINVYGSDSTTIPTALSQMNCPEENEDVGGCLTFGSIPRYLSFKTSSGTPAIVITNCNLTEVSSIS